MEVKQTMVTHCIAVRMLNKKTEGPISVLTSFVNILFYFMCNTILCGWELGNLKLSNDFLFFEIESRTKRKEKLLLKKYNLLFVGNQSHVRL